MTKLWPVSVLFLTLACAATEPDVPVVIGGDEDLDACSSTGVVKGIRTSLAIRAGPGAGHRLLDALNNGDPLFVCGSSNDGKWYSVVYAKDTTAECGVSGPIAKRGTYGGPCKSGWVAARWIEIVAG